MDMSACHAIIACTISAGAHAANTHAHDGGRQPVLRDLHDLPLLRPAVLLWRLFLLRA